NHGTASAPEFTEFFSRASLELIKCNERAAQKAKGKEYRPPAIVANDGQLGPLPFFKRECDAVDPVLRRAKTWMTTHTYKNRQTLEAESGKALLRAMRIPQKRWGAFWRIKQVDITSGGVRSADGANA